MSAARAAGKSGLAYPWRQSAGRALSGQLRAAAQSGQRVERAQSRRAVGLHPRLCAGGFARDQSGPRQAGRLRDQLLRGFREAAEALSRADRQGTRRAGRPGGASCAKLRRRARRRKGAVRGLRSRQAPRLRAAARLVQGAVRSAVRPEPAARASAPSRRCSAARKPRR